MTNLKTSKEYVDWMYKHVSKKRIAKRASYKRLFNCLHAIEFTYTIPLDGNRAEDGIELRYKFGRERNYPDAMIAAYLDTAPCSVLEMMVALAIRCEEGTMYDPEFGDRTGQWFWGMIDNLGLSGMTDEYFDEEFVNEVIFRLLNRKYQRDGYGGLFTVKHHNADMRNVEIWYQACFYLSEVLGLD